MEWIKIDKDNLPEGEVLAGNFEPNTHGYKEKLVGYLYTNGKGNVTCVVSEIILNYCTHYININDYDPER
jgi:hypothetical protein